MQTVTYLPLRSLDIANDNEGETDVKDLHPLLN